MEGFENIELEESEEEEEEQKEETSDMQENSQSIIKSEVTNDDQRSNFGFNGIGSRNMGSNMFIQAASKQK